MLTVAKFGYNGGGAELAMLQRPGKQEFMRTTPSVAVPAPDLVGLWNDDGFVQFPEKHVILFDAKTEQAI